MSKESSIVLGHQICGYCHCSPRKLLHGMDEVELHLLLSSPFSGVLEVFYILGLFYTASYSLLTTTLEKREIGCSQRE